MISIIVPHRDDLDNLDRCLSDLHGQVSVPGRFEIIVADNASRCDRARLEAICGDRCRLIDAPIPGAAEARNVGVHASTAALLAFIDSDCRPAQHWLAAGVRALGTGPLVGGRVDVAVEDVGAMTPTEAFERVFAFNNERYIREEQFSVTANLFTTRAVFDTVGGFRTGVSEDLDWGRRAVAAGYTWTFAEDAAIEHPARREWADLVRKWKRLMAESFGLARERRGGRLFWIGRNWAMLLSLPIAIIQVLRSSRVSTVADRRHALQVLVRLRGWRFVEAHRLARL